MIGLAGEAAAAAPTWTVRATYRRGARVAVFSAKPYDEEFLRAAKDGHGHDVLDALAGGVLSRLLPFPNVLVTGHQAFFTRDALESIALTTIGNISAFERGDGTLYRVTADG